MTRSQETSGMIDEDLAILYRLRRGDLTIPILHVGDRRDFAAMRMFMDESRSGIDALIWTGTEEFP
jgi:hypothetical protein